MSDFRAAVKKKKTNKFSGRNYWRQEGIGSSTVLREPKAEGYHRKWAGESHGCYSCRQPVHKKRNAPSQQERWNCDEQKCSRSEGGNITYSTSEKRKTKAPAQTKSHKTNHIHSLKKEKNKVTLAPNRLTIKGVEIPLDSKTSEETKIYTVDSVKLPPRTAISCAAKLIPSEPNEENLYQVISKEVSGMHVNMEEDEKQRMEDFVRGLFSKTDDFNLLTKKIVGKKYLQHSQKDSLNPQQKSIFADIIVKLLFEFNVGNEESVKANENKIITPPSAQEKSGVPEDGNSNSPSELSKSAQETQPQTLLSRIGSCPKVENETSLDACTTEVIELEEKEDVEAVEKKIGTVQECKEVYDGRC